MSDEPTEPTVEEPEQDSPDESGTDEPDWKAMARKWEKRAKENSEAAARLKELEDAQKTEQERLAEQLESERSQARQSAIEAARYRAAMQHGLTPDHLDFLGDDPEQIEERAQKFAQLIAEKTSEPVQPSRRPQERLKAGAAPDVQASQSPEEVAAAAMRRRKGF